MVTTGLTPWPEALAGSPAIAVLERAVARGRLSHSLLLHGDDLETLTAVAYALADRLLTGAPDRPHFPPPEHPDCFILRPAGKTRAISADATRDLISAIQVSAAVSARKVAIVMEADRMNAAAANIFLKTLEEPPPNTMLLLLTTRPYALLATIRSRALHFRFPSPTVPLAADGWSPWLEDYQAWLLRLADPTLEKQSPAEAIFSAYGLIARFAAVLDAAASAAWKKEKEHLPANLAEDEEVAMETGLANGLRARMFAEIEQATRAQALPRLEAGDETTRRALVEAIAKLERSAGLLRLNMNESTALENFLLASLRIWSRR